MDDQNPQDPLVLDAANLYNENREKFIARAQAYTIQYASTE